MCKNRNDSCELNVDFLNRKHGELDMQISKPCNYKYPDRIHSLF